MRTKMKINKQLKDMINNLKIMIRNQKKTKNLLQEMKSKSLKLKCNLDLLGLYKRQCKNRKKELKKKKIHYLNNSPKTMPITKKIRLQKEQ